MSQAGYQEGSEPLWWWRVAQHLDEAQAALVNAMAHNLGDSTELFALQDKLCEGQGILLAIFQAKGLVPGAVAVSAPEVVSPVGGSVPPANPLATTPSEVVFPVEAVVVSAEPGTAPEVVSSGSPPVVSSGAGV